MASSKGLSYESYDKGKMCAYPVDPAELEIFKPHLKGYCRFQPKLKGDRGAGWIVGEEQRAAFEEKFYQWLIPKQPNLPPVAGNTLATAPRAEQKAPVAEPPHSQRSLTQQLGTRPAWEQALSHIDEDEHPREDYTAMFGTAPVSRAAAKKAPSAAKDSSKAASEESVMALTEMLREMRMQQEQRFDRIEQELRGSRSNGHHDY